MKKLLFAVIILLFSSSVIFGGGIMPAIIAGSTAGSGGELCSSCTPGDPSDVLCEDFGGSTLCATGEASVCRCSWTEAGESDGTGTFSASGLEISANNSSAFISYTRDISTEIQVYVEFTLDITSESLSDGEVAQVAGITHDSGYESLEIRQTSGSLYVDLRWNANVISGTTSIDGTDDLIEFYVNESTSSMQLWVNGVSQGTGTANWEALDTFDISTYQPDAAITYVVSDVRVDDDTMP